MLADGAEALLVCLFDCVSMFLVSTASFGMKLKRGITRGFVTRHFVSRGEVSRGDFLDSSVFCSVRC